MRATQMPRGFALLIVLWSLVLLSLLATGITAAGRSQLQLAGNLRRSAAAEAAADGGIYAAAFHASDTSPRAWLPDGSAHTMRIGGYELDVRIRDESAFLNPNTAPPELFAALLIAIGAEPTQATAIAQSVVDWRAPGAREPVIQRYRSAGLSAAPTGQPFRSIDELGLVIGMTPQLLAQLRPHLSIFTEGPVQAARADTIIQSALRSLGGGTLSASTTDQRC